MYPFEFWDEETQTIRTNYLRFNQYRSNLFEQYSTPLNHRRVELELSHPADRLEDVFVHDWNPHHEIGNTHLSVYDCFYDDWNWSTIFEVYPYGNHIKVFAEHGHQEPWGEPVRLMSTSFDLYDPTSHRYAYFRNQYWKVFDLIGYAYLDIRTFISQIPLLYNNNVFRQHPLTRAIHNFDEQITWVERFFTPSYYNVNWESEGF